MAQPAKQPHVVKANIYDKAFEDDDELLSPEKAHARAQKEAKRLEKQRSEVLCESWAPVGGVHLTRLSPFDVRSFARQRALQAPPSRTRLLLRVE